MSGDDTDTTALHDIGQEGSDMTRDIQVALVKEDEPGLRHVRSLPPYEFVMYQDIGKASDLATPGGFRRDHVITTKLEEGEDAPEHAYRPFMNVVQTPSAWQLAISHVGETYDDFVSANFRRGKSMIDDKQTTPLLRRVYDSHRKEERGASVKKTVFTILKSFIGSGVLFLPKGFQNGGMLFSIVALVISAILSAFCMLRLAECSMAMRPANGDT